MGTDTVAAQVAADSLDPSLLAGATACHRMMATVEGLALLRGRPDPAIENDDGQRHDYEGADLAIREALDTFAGNAGFRIALSNYLLTLHDAGAPLMSKWSPAKLLTDSGYRPAPSTLAETLSKLPQDERGDLSKVTNDICYQAAQEITAVAAMLRQQRDSSMEFEYVLHGSLIRLEALGSAIVATLGTAHSDEIAENYATVYGENLLVLLGKPLEVDHG